MKVYLHHEIFFSPLPWSLVVIIACVYYVLIPQVPGVFLVATSTINVDLLPDFVGAIRIFPVKICVNPYLNYLSMVSGFSPEVTMGGRL